MCAPWLLLDQLSHVTRRQQALEQHQALQQLSDAQLQQLGWGGATPAGCVWQQGRRQRHGVGRGKKQKGASVKAMLHDCVLQGHLCKELQRRPAFIELSVYNYHP